MKGEVYLDNKVLQKQIFFSGGNCFRFRGGGGGANFPRG